MGMGNDILAIPSSENLVNENQSHELSNPLLEETHSFNDIPVVTVVSPTGDLGEDLVTEVAPETIVVDEDVPQTMPAITVPREDETVEKVQQQPIAKPRTRTSWMFWVLILLGSVAAIVALYCRRTRCGQLRLGPGPAQDHSLSQEQLL